MNNTNSSEAQRTLLSLKGDWGLKDFEVYYPKRPSSVISKLNIKIDMEAFPRCEFGVEIDSANLQIEKLNRGDHVSVKHFENGARESRIMFNGEVNDVKIERRENRSKHIHVTARSGFHRLFGLEFSKGIPPNLDLFNTLDFIFRACGINGTLILDKSVDNKLSLIHCSRNTALNIFNSILHHKDLVYQCHVGDVLEIFDRTSYLRKTSQDFVTLRDEDIESYEFRR